MSPIKQIQFSLYDDIKFSLTGTIDNPMFADMVKNYFMRICALKFQKQLDFNRPVSGILFGKASGEEIADARKFQDKSWLDYLTHNV